MKEKIKKMSLSEKEKKELEILDNPEVKDFTSAFNPFTSFLTSKLSNLAKRKERVAELRTKMRLEEAGLDADKDYQMYYKIRAEEENRFDERFKNFFHYKNIITTQNIEKPKKEYGAKYIYGVIIFFAFIIFYSLLSGGNSGNNTPSQTQQVTVTKQKSANDYSPAVYFNKIIVVFEDVTNSIEALKLLESYRRYWKNEDVIEVAKHTLVIEKSYERVKDIAPPKDLVTTHQEVLQVFKLFKDSMPIYRTAMDKSDSQLYSQSMNMILKAVDKLTEITDQFK